MKEKNISQRRPSERQPERFPSEWQSRAGILAGFIRAG
jgi:hypothetical protein